MTARYFSASRSEYEAARQAVDAALGLPDVETKTHTAFAPADEVPVDARGHCYISLAAAHCQVAAIAPLLSTLLVNGRVREITQGEYEAVAYPAGQGPAVVPPSRVVH